MRSILQDGEGHLWFGTDGGGVSRYDEQAFITFTTEDGLAHYRVYSVSQDQQGYLWFGTGGIFSGGEGVCRYDGKSFTTLTVEHGLADR